MMSPLPTGRAGRCLALAVTLALLGMVWAAVVAPLVELHAEQAEHLKQRRVLFQRMAALAQSIPQLRQQAEGKPSLRPAVATATWLEGATDAVAGAELQELVQGMAAQAGTSLTSVETLPVAQISTYHRISLQVSMTTSWPALIRLLQSIMHSTPRMLVDDLELHSLRSLVQPAEPALNAKFIVLAFRVVSMQERSGSMEPVSRSRIAL